MTLATGTRLGPYEILSPIGAGGMGEVYRARDARLGREVAVKVLPAEFSSDAQRRSRFEQEARAASALNHPNIVTVYDVGTAEDHHLFVAMELVEGRTLREILEAGRLPASRTLDIGAQIADGLARAHGAGIVHRDLKPENVMVSREGFVKILDFGLAKLSAPIDGGASDLPTAAPRGTDPGTIMGTVGYMSPEQAAGRAVDFRSDQFSLGTILYERATGKRPFQRESAPQTLSAIIQDDPEPLGTLNPRTPAPLRWAIERCLAKEPDERFASTKDLARDLKSLRDHLSEASQVSGETAAGAVRPGRVPGAFVAAAAAAVVLAAAAAAIVGRKTAPIRVPVFHRLTFERGSIGGARFAPDGQTVLYSATWNGIPSKIFSTRATSPGSSALSLPDALLFSVSSQNELAIAIDAKLQNSFQPAGTLARVPMAGGTPRQILENVAEAEWSPDGAQLAVVHNVSGKSRLEYPIGKVLYETGGWIGHIRISPDGRTIAFLDHPASSDGGTVSTIDAGGGKKRDLSTDWLSLEGIAWAPGGGEIFFTGTRTGLAWKIYGVRPGGPERFVLSAPSGMLIRDVARDGRMLVSQDEWRAGISAQVPGGDGERDLSNLDYSQVRDISADGSVITLDESGEGGGEKGAVYLRKTDGSPAVRLGEGNGASLSADGAWAASTNYDGTAIVFYPTGPGQARSLPCKGMNCYFPTFFPDGRRIAFLGVETGRGPKIFVTPVDAMAPKAISPEGVAFTTVYAVSPDGRRIAALGVDAKPAIFSADGAPPRPIPDTDVLDIPMRWTPDGSSVYISRANGSKTVLSKIDVASGRRTIVREVKAADPAGVQGILRVYPTPDARSFAYSYVRVLSTLFEVEGVR
ncbi:MAG TPA: protein kinase [Thermoanaerobaculia bacterium]|nr:protein kinase [Thermoanaerobaculia bacterium]